MSAENRREGKGPLDCDGIPTPPLDEGPFYKPDSPERINIAADGTAGARLIVEGHVFDRDCRPLPGAWLDFWQADGHGAYDNAGYNLRGHQFTDKSGYYHLETVRPVGYGPRTAHIHVKVRENDSSPVFTTQLFLPGEKKNQTDPIFNSSLVMDVKSGEGGETASFNFVLDTG